MSPLQMAIQAHEWRSLAITLKKKKLHSKSLAEVTMKPNESPFWKGLMKVKNEFLSRGSFIVGNGMDTRFWEDTWLGDKPLSQQYPSLYSIVQWKQVLVANVLSHIPLNISFRMLSATKRTLWLQLVQRLMNVHLNEEKDNFIWGLTNSGQYTVKSLYLDLINDDTKYLKKYIWKMKVCLKIKIFMWFLHRKEILTKDNLISHNWIGRESCCFCDEKESIQHL
jgi:hypothetical protein